jgi:hypothetical protein
MKDEYHAGVLFFVELLDEDKPEMLLLLLIGWSGGGAGIAPSSSCP